MRNAVIALAFGLLFFPTVARAQNVSLKTLLVVARRDTWSVRISTLSDTTQGVIRNVFRDTVYVGNSKLPVSAITKLERRVGDDWRTQWPMVQVADSASGPAIYTGPAAHVFAGPTFLIFPEVLVGLPPPLHAGVELGLRDETSETTFAVRTLMYPIAFWLFAADVGRNSFRGRTYTGFAAGGIFSREGSDIALSAGGRVGHLSDHGGARSELRVDAVLIESEFAVIVSGSIGLSRSRLR